MDLDYPHRCPVCGAAAYIGFKNVACSNPGCTHAEVACKTSASSASFLCWNGAWGGPRCSGIVTFVDGLGVCPKCGSPYTSGAAAGMSRP
jgi:hypothetical protein